MTIDSRAYSSTPLDAPAPLPYVSRRALRRVSNPLPAPTTCYCGGKVHLVNNSAIYGKEFGAWPYAYRCVVCDAYVGLHPDTDIPLGILADRGLREARREHKAAFQRLIRDTEMSRSEAYAWLAGQLGIEVGECHWGWFDVSMCKRAGAACRKRLEGESA